MATRPAGVQDSPATISSLRKGATVQDMFRHLHMPPELAIQFMAVFSRTEYALKVTTYAVGNESKVEANWDRFANTVNDALLAIADADVIAAREFLLANPPRKQVLSNSKVDFKDQVIDTAQRPTQQVLLVVRTIRNNLFHGGKYLPNGEQEPGRNKELVTHALRVLVACSTLDEDVHFSFEH